MINSSQSCFDTFEPLHRLLCKGVTWEWTQEQQGAIDGAKELLQSTLLFVHYDPYKPLRLTMDSSSYGVGAMLSHDDDKNDDGIQIQEAVTIREELLPIC